MTDAQDPYQEIIQRLKARREMLGLSQSEVSRLSGVGQSNISAAERGAYVPGWEMLVRWGRGLRMDVKVGMILNCAEYREPYFVDLTPKADAKPTYPRRASSPDPRP